MPRLAPPLLLAALLAGCAGSGRYPDLQIRPGETPRQIDSVEGAAVTSLSSEEQALLDEDLAQSGRALDDLSRRLQRTMAAVRKRLAASGASTRGSDAWGEAQMALSQLQDLRGELADVETRLVPMERQTDGLPGSDAHVQRLHQLRERLHARTTEVDSLLSQASTRLGS